MAMASFTAAGFVEALNADDISQVERGLGDFIRACSSRRRDSSLEASHGARKRKRLDSSGADADISSRVEEKDVRKIIHEYVRSSPHCAELFRLWDEQITGGALVKGLDSKQSHQLFVKVVQALAIVLAHLDEERFQPTRVVVVKKLLQKKMRSLHGAMTSSEDNATARHVVTLFTVIVRQGTAFARELSQKLSFSSAAFLGPLVRSVRGKRATSKALFDAYLSFALALLKAGNPAVINSLLKSDGLLAMLIAQANETLSASRTCALLDALRLDLLNKEAIPMMKKMDLFAQRKVIVGGVVECLASSNERLRLAAKTLLEEFTIDSSELRQLRRIRSMVAAALAPTRDPVQLDLLVALLESDVQVKTTYMRSAWKLTLDPRPSFQWLRNITVAIRLLGTTPKVGKGGVLALPPDDLLPKALISRGIQHENKLVVLHSIDMAIAILAHCREVFQAEQAVDVARLRMGIIARLPDVNVVRAARTKWAEDEWILHRATRLLHWYQQVIPLALAGRVDFSKLLAQMAFEPAKPTSCATLYILLQLLDESSTPSSTTHLPKLLSVYRGLPDKRWRSVTRRIFHSAVRHMAFLEEPLITDACLDLLQCEAQESFLLDGLQVLKAKSAPSSSVDLAIVLLKKATRPEEITFAAHVGMYAFLNASKEERDKMRSAAPLKESLSLVALAESLMNGVEAAELVDSANSHPTLERRILTEWETISPVLSEHINSRCMDVSVAARYCALLSHVAGNWIERNVPTTELNDILQVLMTVASQFASREIVQACLQNTAFTNPAVFSSDQENVVQAICAIMRTISASELPHLQSVVSAAKASFSNKLDATHINSGELDVCSFALYSLSDWLSPATRCSMAKAVAKRLPASPGDSVVSLLKLWLKDLQNTHDLVAESFELAKFLDTEEHLELLYRIVAAHANGSNRTGGLYKYLRGNAGPNSSVSWLWTSLKESQLWKSKVVMLLAERCRVREEIAQYFHQCLDSGEEDRARALLNVYVVSNSPVEPHSKLQPLANYMCNKILRQGGSKYKTEVATFIRKFGSTTVICKIVDEFLQETKKKVLPLATMRKWFDLDMSLRTDSDRGSRFLVRYLSSAFCAKDFGEEGFEVLWRCAKEFVMTKAHQKSAFKVGLKRLRRNLSTQVVEAMRLLVENSSDEVVGDQAHHIQVALVSHAEFIDLRSASQVLKREALLLLLSITKRSPEKCCSRAIFLMLQSFYHATLSDTDCLLHQILACYAEFDSIFAPANFGYLYGQHVQPDLFEGELLDSFAEDGDEDEDEEVKVSTAAQVARLINARYVPLLEGLSGEKMKQTVESFPFWRTRQNVSGLVGDADESIYDVAFIIPLLDHLLSMFQYAFLADDSEDTGLLSPCREIVSVGALSLLFKGMSSECTEIRRSSAAGLRRFGQLTSRASLFRERSQMIVLLRNVRYAVESPDERLSGLVSSFLAQSAYLMLHPPHALYALVNSFLLKRPNIDVKDVPMFYELFNTGEEGTLGGVSRTWIMEVLFQGVHSKEDLHILSRRYALSSVVAFVGNPLCSVKEKRLALQLLQRVAEIQPEGAIALVNIGFFSWLASLSTCPGLPRTIDAILAPLLQLSTKVASVTSKLSSRESLDKQISIVISAVITALRHFNDEDLGEVLPCLVTFIAKACGLDMADGKLEINWQNYVTRPKGHQVTVSLQDLNWLFSKVRPSESTLLDKALFVLLHCEIKKETREEACNHVFSLAFDATLGNKDECQRLRVNLLQKWLKRMQYTDRVPAMGPFQGAFNTLMLTSSR